MIYGYLLSEQHHNRYGREDEVTRFSRDVENHNCTLKWAGLELHLLTRPAETLHAQKTLNAVMCGVLGAFLAVWILSAEAIKFQTGPCESEQLCGDGVCTYGNRDDKFWCRCEEGYGGDHCEKKCDLSCEPHHKCIFDIAKRPTCVCKDCDKYGNQTIQCQLGFGGADCSIQGWCYPDECLHGGKCVGSGDSAHCVCRREYTGQRCELDFDECSVPDFCNNGKCFNLNGSYLCQCHDGFFGAKCEHIVDPEHIIEIIPKENPCVVVFLHNFTDGHGFECHHHGACVTYAPNKTRCECAPGFEGEICEKDIDECAYDPCENGATCVNSHGDFECFCRSGYDGKFCENNIDDCVGHKCAPGSKCVDGPSTYTCECEHGKMGAYCDKVNPCIADPFLCHGRGICTGMPDTGDFVCTCDRGFDGDRCEIDVDICETFGEETLCPHNGRCIDLPDDWACECARGFSGPRCEFVIDICEAERVECQNGGSCFSGPFREPLCQCEQGYIGRRCETKCPEGYGGLRCNIHLEDKVCGPNLAKCLNGGVCAGGFCICHANYTGDRCELSRIHDRNNSDLCSTEPCLNNSTCINVDHQIGFVCMCKEGYYVNVCENHFDLCSLKPCYNDGKCQKTRQLERGYSCQCRPGYEGANCEILNTTIDCYSRDCHNGVCVDEANSTKCVCHYGYAGAECEEDLGIGKYDHQNRLIHEMCVSRRCQDRAGDGVCDSDCNFAECQHDGGDCSVVDEAFAKCKYRGMCAALYANGICDIACNNEDCLYDGMDCMPLAARCPLAIRESCERRYADGNCDFECDTEGCGYDGGDCSDENTTRILDNIRIKFLMSRMEFETKAHEFVMKASASFRAIFRIQRDKKGPLVFEWDETTNRGYGRRIDVNMTRWENPTVMARAGRSMKRGVMALIEVAVASESVDRCATTSQRPSCLFTDANSVANFLSAQITTKGNLLGVPVYEVAVGSRAPRISFRFMLLILVCVGGPLSLYAYTMMMSSASTRRKAPKRRIVECAGTWYFGKHGEPTMVCEPKKMRSSFELVEMNHGYAEPFTSSASPPLHIQAAGSHPITIPLTFENVNERHPKFQRTVLHWLADNSQQKMEFLIVSEAERCISAGANVDVIDCDSNTPLILASRRKRLKLVLVLMRVGADTTKLNKSERNALHEAAANLDLRMMEVLLRDSRLVARIDDIDRNGMSALMEVASLDSDTRIVKLLVEMGADIGSDGFEEEPSESFKGRSALHYASLYGNVKIMQFFIALNVDVDKMDVNDETPLMLAIKNGKLDAVRLLLNNGADMDMPDRLEKSAIQVASELHYDEIVRELELARQCVTTSRKRVKKRRKRTNTRKAKKKDTERKDSSNSEEDVTPYNDGLSNLEEEPISMNGSPIHNVSLNLDEGTDHLI
ncbi:unnamed protein product [Caenorhabditis bovis]|uniref:Uncharacterized protein n=1 Tax=Caenorhabditis bovis TaxID=2654633 RepID=A0A8S1EUU3_9PELO|nr:unnamed protein product [Caenorhabditis bovis]